MRALTEQGKTDKGVEHTQSYDHTDDVYDFADLRHQYEVNDQGETEEDDGLGDQLIEEGDDNNMLTFGDAPIDQDFDFSGNTQRFQANIPEEEAFFVKRKHHEEPQGGFRNPWASTPVRQTSSGIGRSFGEASPMASAKSIWGNFGGGLSPGSQHSLSPFSTANRQAMRPQPQQQQQPPFMSPTTSTGYPSQQQQQQQQRRPVTLEDIEADIQRQQAANRYRVNHGSPNGKTLSLAELEAALAAGAMSRQQQPPPPPPQQQPQQPFGYPTQPDPMQLLAMKQQQELKEQQLSMARELKRRELHRKSQYDGLMTQHDKDVVNRIQLSQLASGDPYADDFYYQVYTTLRQRPGMPLQTNIPLNNATNEPGRTGRGRREENMMQRMQQQLQRIVNDAKRRPKQTQVSLEGALGKITSLTVRNPRQVLQVPSATNNNEPHMPKTETSPTHPKSFTAYDRRQVLKITEDMYTIVLEIEEMRRQGVPKDEENEKDAMEAFNQKYAAKVEKLWKTLRLTEHAESSFLISLLSTAKGKKLIPRIVRQLSHDQNLALLTVLMANFSKLQVCRHVIYPGTTVANVDEAKKQLFVLFDEVELFMNATAPHLLGFITDAPLRIVVGLLQLFLEKNDIGLVAQTKPGLAFLTMLLSRAEILKQGGGSLQGLPPPTPEEMNRWQELYGHLFNGLKGRYLSIFPSLYYLVPLNPNTPMMQLSLAVDDMYVWQFLAAMAVGASMDQQHILVTEVRDRVMDNIVLAKRNRLPLDQATHRISNVNLFLHALGLDASQVSVPL
ncbi:topoisomerase II-associated protein PAT1-domain-containing protein [Gilbertella persicaria]|uniref:topoisomerase II-associated protein PAT1-domain-containing protein n=1 Tax=Gilbertella persicaria TaxID=101096 RepID=UPI00221ED4AA|nr:topoisomerase II-associated protein PAT1-domain-containing protein [Gilbertella persicaria]KAI8095121.1 topoisomerase II-associated protein PAT1-domain-containing protein [Gilbertella persicaria]